MNQQHISSAVAVAGVGVIAGALAGVAHGATPLGEYKTLHHRVVPEHQAYADFLARKIEDAHVAGNKSAVHALSVELRDLPRYLVGEYDAPNLVTDVGARLMLDTILAGSAFTATCYLGLKGSGSAAFGDTMASHAGWLEVGGANAPAFSSPANRPTVTFSAAAGSTGSGNRSKASSGTMTFTFSSGGTVDGAFLNINGAATKDNTTGTLFSVGTFSGGAKVVAATDTLTVTYTLSA